MQKKFLLRLSEEKYQRLANMAGEKSLNQYINEVLDSHILKVGGRITQMETIAIGTMTRNELREAVVVTQKPWYMDILDKYNICFFSASKIVSPMMYLLVYGDSECDPPKCISRFGKVSYIYRNATREDLESLPQLRGLLNDPLYGSEINNTDLYQIAFLSEVTKLEKPLPLTNEYINAPNIIRNRVTTMSKFLGAKKIDDLFK